MINETKIDNAVFPGSLKQGNSIDQLYHTAEVFVSNTTTQHTITSLEFTPNLPVGKTIPLLIVGHHHFTWGSGLNTTITFSNTAGSPFSGTEEASGVYRDVEIGDVITIRASSGITGADATFIFMAIF